MLRSSVKGYLFVAVSALFLISEQQKHKTFLFWYWMVLLALVVIVPRASAVILYLYRPSILERLNRVVGKTKPLSFPLMGILVASFALGSFWVTGNKIWIYLAGFDLVLVVIERILTELRSPT